MAIDYFLDAYDAGYCCLLLAAKSHAGAFILDDYIVLSFTIRSRSPSQRGIQQKPENWMDDPTSKERTGKPPLGEDRTNN